MTLEQRVLFEGEEEEVSIFEPGEKDTKTFRFESINGVENRYLPVEISCDNFTHFGRIKYEYIQNGSTITVDRQIDDQHSLLSLALRSSDGKKQGIVTWKYYPNKGVYHQPKAQSFVGSRRNLQGEYS